MWNLKPCWWMFQLHQNPGCVLPFDRLFCPRVFHSSVYGSCGQGWCVESCRPSSVHVKKLVCWQHRESSPLAAVQLRLADSSSPKFKFLLWILSWATKSCLFCFPLFLFKEMLSNIKALTTTVCLPFVLSVKMMFLRKVASSACNSSDCAVFLGQ